MYVVTMLLYLYIYIFFLLIAVLFVLKNVFITFCLAEYLWIKEA